MSSSTPSESPLVDCPACKTPLYVHARECPRCGFRPDHHHFEEVLGTMTTISSILVGFTLASLVALATDESKAIEQWTVSIAAGCWLFSSVLLVIVILRGEQLRRHQSSERTLISSPAEDDFIERECNQLLWAFALGIVATVLGVFLIGCHFSLWHLGAAFAALALGVAIVWPRNHR